MHYYRIDVYDRAEEDYCFIDRTPKEIHLLSAYIASGDVALPEYPASVVAKMDDGGGPMLTDFVGNSELMLMCSARVTTVIREMLGDKCEYLPVSIENHKGRIASEDYFYVNPLGTYDCLHKTHSEIDYTDDGKVIGVDKFVFDAKAMSRVPDMFRVPEDDSEYFVSQRLVNAIQQAITDVTNLNLYSIEVAE